MRWTMTKSLTPSPPIPSSPPISRMLTRLSPILVVAQSVA
jgi:hypothetical protein